MVKNHLKSIAVPRTWPIKRKNKIWVTRPNSGAHTLAASMPLNTVVKDMLGLAKNTKEVKFILNNNEVLADMKRRTDKKYSIGIMDTLSFSTLKKYYRVMFDKYGKLILTEIDEKESKIKPSKISDKKHIKKGKIQLNMEDGRNIIVEKDSYKTGDSLLIELPSQKIVKHLPLQKGAYVFLIGGKHLGSHGKVEEIEGKNLIFKTGKSLIKTLKKYALVVGEDKSEIKLIE